MWVPLATSDGAWASIVAFFRQPLNIPALFAALVVGRMAQYTSDQVMVQRLQTTKSVTDARRAFIVNAAGDALWMIGLSFVGLALFAYFQHHPAPAGLASDRIFRTSWRRHFRPGPSVS